MADLGKFDPQVVEKLNHFFTMYLLAPGYGNDDETTYYVAKCCEGVVEDWVSLDMVESEEGGG